MGKQLKLQVLPRNCLLAFGLALNALAFDSALWPLLDLQGLLGAIGGIFLSCADVSVSSGPFEHALGLSNMQGNFKIATFCNFGPFLSQLHGRRMLLGKFWIAWLIFEQAFHEIDCDFGDFYFLLLEFRI